MADIRFKGNSDAVGDDENEELQNIVPILTLKRMPKYDCMCTMCHQVAIDHRISNCNHLFCKGCFDKIKGERCPIHKEVEIKTYHKDKRMSARIMDLKVFCPYKDNGCKESKSLKDILNHIHNCSFKNENILPKLYCGKPRDDDIDKLTNTLTALHTSINEVELKLKKMSQFNSDTDSILTRCRNDIDAMKKITDPVLAEINQVKNNYEELKEQISKTFEEKSKEYELQLNKLQRSLQSQPSSEIEHELKKSTDMILVMHQQIMSTQTENLLKQHDEILTEKIELRKEITNSIAEMKNKIESHSDSTNDKFATIKNEMQDPLHKKISKLENEFHKEYKSYGKRLNAMKEEIQQKEENFNERFQLLVPQNEAQSRAQLKEIVRDQLTEYQEVTLKPQIMNTMKTWEGKNEAMVKNQTEEIKFQLIPSIHDILSKHYASTLLNKVTDLKSACSEEVSDLSKEFQEIINPLLNIATEYRLPQLISQLESKVTGQRERPADEMALAILKLSATDANQRESRIDKYVKAIEDKMENCIEKVNTFEKTMQSALQNEVESNFSKLRNESQDDVKQQPEQHILATGQRERPADEMALTILKLSATDANQTESRIAEHVKAVEDKMENCVEKVNTFEKTMQSAIHNEVESNFSKLRNESQDDVKQQPAQHILGKCSNADILILKATGQRERPADKMTLAILKLTASDVNERESRILAKYVKAIEDKMEKVNTFEKTTQSALHNEVESCFSKLRNESQDDVKQQPEQHILATGQSIRPADEMALAILKRSASDANQRESRILAKYVKAIEDKMENCSEKVNTFGKTMQSALHNEVESNFSKLRNKSQDDVKPQPEQHILEKDQCLEEDKHQSADESFEEKYQSADETFKENKYQSADKSFEENNSQTTDHSTEKHKHQTVDQSLHQPKHEEYYEMTTWKVTGIKQKLLKNEQQNGGTALSHDLQFSCQLCCELIAQLEIVGKSDLLLISLKSIHDASNYDECSLASLHVTEYRLLDQSESSKKNDIRLVDQLDHLRRDVQPTKTNLVSITELKSTISRFVKDDCIVIQIIIKPKHLLYGHVAGTNPAVEYR